MSASHECSPCGHAEIGAACCYAVVMRARHSPSDCVYAVVMPVRAVVMRARRRNADRVHGVVMLIAVHAVLMPNLDAVVMLVLVMLLD